MQKSSLGVIVGLIAVRALVGIVLASRPDNKQPASNTGQTTQSNQADRTEEATDNSSEAANPSAQTSAVNTVEIANFEFKPETVTVKKGTTVTWTNNDSTAHTVTPDEESDEFKGSELLSQGQTYEVTFNTPGTFSYHCEPHPQMKATVVVTE